MPTWAAAPDCQKLVDSAGLDPQRTLDVPGGGRGGPGIPGTAELSLRTPYDVLRVLAQGGMGMVYLARDRRDGGLAVLKVANRDASGIALARQRREYAILRALDHPGIVKAYAAYEQPGWLALVMEYLPGQTLAEILRDRGPLPPGVACRIARDLLRALHHAAERGFTHGDIKPANVVIDGPTVRLLDFGSASGIGEADQGEPSIYGNPGYMPPERIRGVGRSDPRGDCYAVGCTLYEMLTGQKPFPSGPFPEALLRRLTEDPPPLERVRRNFPHGLPAVVRRMMARDPADRFSSHAVAATHLGPFASPQPLDRPASEARDPDAADRRSGVLVAIAVVFFLLHAVVRLARHG